jgi:hypothetical protein
MKVIDYIAFIGPYPPPKDWEEAERIYNSLKSLSLQYDIAIVMPSQGEKMMQPKVQIKKIPVPKVVMEERVILEISREEAQALYDLTGRIGGQPKTSRRGLMDSIGRALSEVGFNASSQDMFGTISFSESPEPQK